MSWIDRIKEGAVTSESGERIVFQFEDLSRTTVSKGSSYEFANFDGTLAISTGSSSKRYPIQAFFSGENNDLEATEFERIVLSGGVLLLEHPVHGQINVVPIGDVTRSDALKSAGNITTIELEFFETILDFFPLENTDYSQQTTLAAEDLTNLAAESFNSVPSRSSFKQGIKEAANFVRGISNGVAEVQQDFNEIEADLNRALDVAVVQPINIAFQTLRLIQTPARVFENISARLKASKNLLLSLTGANFDASKDLIAIGALQLASLSAINSDLKVKSDAVLGAETILGMFDDWRNWRDADADETGEVSEAMYRMVSLVSAYLIEISFSLIPEKRMTLEEPRTIIDLCSELYGDETMLNFFITSNDFTADEILLIPRGRQVVYYI